MLRLLRCLAVLLALHLLSLPVTAVPPQARGEPRWEDARAAIEAWYKKELPEARLEEIAPGQEREILDFGLTVRHYARVRVQRGDQLRDRDNVAVTFARVAGKWEVSNVRIVGSQPLPEMDPPAEAEAQRLFREVWKKDKCEGYQITAVKITTEPRFQRETISDRTKAKRWFIYELEIAAIGTGDFRISEEGVPYVLKITNGLLWNPAEKSWVVDPRWVKCSGFVKATKQ